MTVEIVAGLHQLHVPLTGSSIGYVLPYLFEVPGGYAIIDPGWDADESVQALRSQLNELGVSFRDIKDVIVTHSHPDHYGMAGRLREESGARVHLHEKELDFLRWRPDYWEIGRPWFASHGFPEADESYRPRPPVERPDPDATFNDDTPLRLGAFELQVMWTPGHTPGHACFYEPRHELLLTGDHVLPEITPSVGQRPGFDEDDPLGDYLRSLQRLRGLPVRRVLPAHKYSFGDLDARLDQLEAHHERRLQEMVDAVDAGATSAFDISRGVTWSIGHFDGFNERTQRMAMTETIAHLRHLVLEGVLETFSEPGRQLYRRTRRQL